MNIPQRIDKIIEERRKALPSIEASVKRVKAAKRAVERLDAFRARQNNEQQDKWMNTLTPIVTNPFYGKCNEAIQQLNYLQKRFSRERINISFVGRAGQGKSLVLQRISGLGSDIIPSADGMDCTGARSIISNTVGTETKAEITFFSELEYVNIVNRYLKTIFPDKAYRVSTLSEVSTIDIQKLRQQVDYSEAVKNASLSHLEKYIAHAMELKEMLGTSVTVLKDKIESYVAQYNSKNPDEKYYTYLGVKEANILSAFPCEHCGKIVLVDTIGTGTTALGVEDDMLRTVREDSDAIILMLRPDSHRPKIESTDYELVKKISDTVSYEYAKQMLFWVINRVEIQKGYNADRIPEIMGELNVQELPVAQCLNVNCWEQEDVENYLLIPILEQMSANLTSIDNILVERVNQQLAELEDSFHHISASVERALGISINGEERKEFRRRIRETMELMTSEMHDLYLQYADRKSSPCGDLEEKAAEKLKNVILCKPSQAEISAQLKNGFINQHNALELLANQLRLNIINDFLGLNHSLHQIILDMKREAVHVMADKGKLGSIVGTDPDDPERWLRAFRSKLDPSQYSLLHKALLPMEEFDLKMENFLIYKVRCCLDPIDWSAERRPPEIVNDYKNKSALAEEIDSILQDRLERVHSSIRNELDEFYIFPNTAMYAVLHDFYDRAAFARRPDGTPVEMEWQDLYEEKISMIWPEEHKLYVAAAGQAEEWRLVTEEINNCAAEGFFLINLRKG